MQHAPVLGRNFAIHSCSFCVFVPFSKPLVELLLFSLGFFVLFRISIRLVSSPCQCALFVKNAFVFSDWLRVLVRKFSCWQRVEFLVGFGAFSKCLFVENAFGFLIDFGPFSESLVVDNALIFWLASGPCQGVYLLRTRLDFWLASGPCQIV